MANTFDGAFKFDRDLSKWQTPRVMNMMNMFSNTKAFNAGKQNYPVLRVVDLISSANDFNFSDATESKHVDESSMCIGLSITERD